MFEIPDIGDALLVHPGQLGRWTRNESGSWQRLSSLGSGSAWTVEDAPPRLVREYNQLVSTYNRMRW